MSLIETFKGAIGKTRLSEEAKRAKLWREYRGTLSRNADPRNGDAERLVGLVGELGIDPGDVERHLSVVESHAIAQRDAARAEAIKAEIAEINKRIEDRASEIEKLNKRFDFAGIGERLTDAERRLNGARGQATNVENMRKQHPELLGA